MVWGLTANGGDFWLRAPSELSEPDSLIKARARSGHFRLPLAPGKVLELNSTAETVKVRRYGRLSQQIGWYQKMSLHNWLEWEKKRERKKEKSQIIFHCTVELNTKRCLFFPTTEGERKRQMELYRSR